MTQPTNQAWHPEHQYLDLLQDLLDNGEEVENRTSVNTIRTLGVTHKYDFKHGFPLLTTKRVYWKGVVHELLWFLKGDTNIKYLVDNGVNIWNDDAYRWYIDQHHRRGLKIGHTETKEVFMEIIKSGDATKFGEMFYGYSVGDLGPVYGKQWRDWTPGFIGDEAIDQVKQLIGNLKHNPSSRRHILSAWNVDDIHKMALPPCHIMSQYTISKGKLWCHMYQRSCDVFLGVPFNVASYSLLTYMIAQCVGVEPGGFIHTMHDAHIYKNHIDAVKEQLTREPRDFPQLVLTPDIKNIDDFRFFDICLENYTPHKTIKADLVVD